MVGSSGTKFVSAGQFLRSARDGNVGPPPITVNCADVLILGKRNLAWAHFDANTVHRLDAPTTGPRNDPLRPRIVVPISNPANRKHRHEHRRVMPRLRAG